MYDDIVGYLQYFNIDAVKLTSKEMKSYKQEWFSKFVPRDKQQKALDCYCFDKDGCCGYLWHVFSYEILDCLVLDKANDAFNETYKHEAILLLNLDNDAYKIKDASFLKAKDLDSLYDVILTDCNYEWTYVKTHESCCGPYYYNPRVLGG